MYLKEERTKAEGRNDLLCWTSGDFKDEKAMYEDDIPTDAKEQGNGHYNSEELLHVFIGPAAEGDFVRLQRLLSKVWGIQGTLKMLGKPCILHSLLHLPVLLSASYQQDKMKKFLSQVSSDEWRPRTWAHLKSKI